MMKIKTYFCRQEVMKEPAVLDRLLDENHGFLEVFERIGIEDTYFSTAIILKTRKWTIV
jgi:hypothetical protein